MKPDEVLPVVGNVDRTYEYHGVQVKFPYEAYQSQQDMMNAILSHVIPGRNLLVESVTGTGKTLALLCSLLAYQEHQSTQVKNPEECSPPKSPKREPRLIFYATRTVSHIKHIIDQLRLTQYAKTPMGILSSVKNTCNNEESDEHLCDYIPEDLAWLDHLNGQPIKAWDLESLKEFCSKNETCAYHELNTAIKNAKIIFCTYKYLLHPGIRQAMNINLKDNILVFDEGHNVEDLCRDVASTPKNFFTLTKVTELTAILQHALTSPKLVADERDHVRNLAEACQKFQCYLKGRLDALVKDNEFQVAVSIEDLQKDLTLVGLGPTQIQELQTDVSRLKENSSALLLENKLVQLISKVQIHRYLSNALMILRFLWDENLNSNYQVLLRRPELDGPGEDDGIDAKGLKEDQPKTDIELKLICLTSAVAFKCATDDAHSVIVASATLSPIAPLTSELGIPFEIQLSANHVIPQDGVFSACIARHSDDRGECELLDLTFDSWRDNEKNYYDQLGKIIKDICFLVPHGIVVFLPSKRRIDELRKSLEPSFATITNHKKVFFESDQRDQHALNEMLKKYKSQAETTQGAILFAVMRGKLSDGVEFRDNQARALVTIGIPFAPTEDPSVKEKRDYQDCKERTDSTGDFNGWDWYCSDAFKTLNQALGRSIRHPQDWCAILLIDSRFSKESLKYKDKLPNWLTNSFAKNPKEKTSTTMEDIIPELEKYIARFVA
ncbi:unnamed protein product [Allacma fusca]|uniref:Helicase ATP-binding domain-containing protein n=1 Tax=Allacma fusca TaxID=39272 RepID=A0A8J2KWP7_9HEXA|nr:unnamed protein product [Allacma fusca]